VLYPLSPPAGDLAGHDSRGPVPVALGQSVGSFRVSGSSGGPPEAIIDHAALWTPTGIQVDLNPAGFAISGASATNGTRQVGFAATTSTGFSQAVLWSGTAATAVDLNPTRLPGVLGSGASGISPDGLQQVGNVTYASSSDAVVWNGTAASAVDLNPSGFGGSIAFGTDGVHQVGQASRGVAGQFHDFHAFLWNGSTASAVDLHPDGFLSSGAVGISGDQQVGSGTIPSANGASPLIHALLWRGTASSVVDLNPTALGFEDSSATFTNGTLQVGSGDLPLGNGGTHALLWMATADSAVDLGSLLDVRFSDSIATSVDSMGDIFGIAHDAMGNATAIEWIPVPDPSLMSVIPIFIVGLVRRRHLKS
jgi:hypothetical protein